MGNLPNSRTITLNPGDPVPSALLNEIQDVLIAGHTTKTKKALIGLTGAGVPIDLSITAASGYQVQLQLNVGDTLVAARAIIKDSATGPTKWQLLLGHNDPTVNTLIATDATGANSTGAGVVQTISVSGASVVVASGKSYYVFVFCSTGAAAGHLYDMEIDYIPA